jgi:hypothetical protein
VSKPVVVIPEGAHSELGPSSAERWINCPGSVLAARSIVAPPSKYAMEGSAAHTVSEWVRRNAVPAETYAGYTLRFVYGDENHDFKCNGAMVRSVQEFVDRVSQLPGHPLIEQMLHYEQYVPGGFGTSDDIRLNDWICYVGDFKHGTGVKKDADMNEQLLLYALGTYIQWHPYFEFAEFDLRIYQPRLEHFDQAEITLKDLLQWAGDVARPAALRALKPGAPFKAGAWCQFCKLRDSCGVRAEYRREREKFSMKNDFELIGLT